MSIARQSSTVHTRLQCASIDRPRFCQGSTRRRHGVPQMEVTRPHHRSPDAPHWSLRPALLVLRRELNLNALFTAIGAFQFRLDGFHFTVRPCHHSLSCPYRSACISLSMSRQVPQHAVAAADTVCGWLMSGRPMLLCALSNASAQEQLSSVTPRARLRVRTTAPFQCCCDISANSSEGYASGAMSE